jgi:hypothetical protein
MKIRPFDPASATDDELRAAHTLSVQIRQERCPQDLPTTFEQFVSNVTSVRSPSAYRSGGH